MGKPYLRHLRDSEGIVHFDGAAQCVNPALCGNNDTAEEVDAPVDCMGCIATIEHIYGHRRPNA